MSQELNKTFDFLSFCPEDNQLNTLKVGNLIEEATEDKEELVLRR